MATQSVLARRQRFQSRSDRERDKLQAQISTYAIRTNQDRALADENHALREADERISNDPPRSESRLNTVIDHLHAAVDAVVPCRSCGRVGAHELGCSVTIEDRRAGV